MEQWPDIGDGRLESGLGLSGSIIIPDQAMTVKWPISFLWICVGKCEYKDTVLVERTEQSQMPLDKCLMQVTRNNLQVLQKGDKSTQDSGYCGTRPGQPWRALETLETLVSFSLFPFSPKNQKKKKKDGKFPRPPAIGVIWIPSMDLT